MHEKEDVNKNTHEKQAKKFSIVLIQNTDIEMSLLTRKGENNLNKIKAQETV